MGRYKQPRRLNWVTLLLLAVGAAGVYGVARFGPALRMRWRASEIVGQAVYRLYRYSYHTGALRGEEERALREEVVGRLHAIGVTDPEMAVSFAQSDKQLTVSVEYTVEVRHFWSSLPTRLRFHPTASTTTERPFQ